MDSLNNLGWQNYRPSRLYTGLCLLLLWLSWSHLIDLLSVLLVGSFLNVSHQILLSFSFFSVVFATVYFFPCASKHQEMWIIQITRVSAVLFKTLWRCLILLSDLVYLTFCLASLCPNEHIPFHQCFVAQNIFPIDTKPFHFVTAKIRVKGKKCV